MIVVVEGKKTANALAHRETWFYQLAKIAVRVRVRVYIWLTGWSVMHAQEARSNKDSNTLNICQLH